MQRVRIGLTGLAFVFVAVLLATALAGRPEAEPPLTANSMTAPPDAQKAHAPKEPLAELGVAPGNAEANKAKAAENEAAPRVR